MIYNKVNLLEPNCRDSAYIGYSGYFADTEEDLKRIVEQEDKTQYGVLDKYTEGVLASFPFFIKISRANYINTRLFYPVQHKKEKITPSKQVPMFNDRELVQLELDFIDTDVDVSINEQIQEAVKQVQEENEDIDEDCTTEFKTNEVFVFQKSFNTCNDVYGLVFPEWGNSQIVISFKKMDADNTRKMCRKLLEVLKGEISANK